MNYTQTRLKLSKKDTEVEEEKERLTGLFDKIEEQY